MRMRIETKPGDHVWVVYDGDGFTARGGVAEVDGRIVFPELRIKTFGPDAEHRGKLVTSDVLRAVPITQMLSWANGDARDRLLRAVGVDPKKRRQEQLLDERKRPPAKLRPPAGRKDDAFYTRVARRYLWLVEVEGNRAPAAAIAADNDVPVTTAQSWIRLARARGLLGPGVKGRAGA